MMHREPRLGRLGDRKIPRACRALRGWRMLTPGRSRAAFPLAVWCGLSWRLATRGHFNMAVFLMLAVSTYAWPSELLRLTQDCIVPPAPGAIASWCLMLNPEDRLVKSKTGRATAAYGSTAVRGISSLGSSGLCEARAVVRWSGAPAIPTCRSRSSRPARTSSSRALPST